MKPWCPAKANIVPLIWIKYLSSLVKHGQLLSSEVFCIVTDINDN